MANSNPEYGKPIRWGNVKKIEVERQAFESLFYQLKSVDIKLEQIKVTVGSLSESQSKEIKSLNDTIECLKNEIEKLKNKGGK